MRLRSFLSKHWQWVFLGQIASILGTLALLKVAASLSAPAVFGRFALILAVAFAVSAILFAPVNAWALRHYQEAREERRLRAFYHGLIVSQALSTLAAVLLALAAVALFRSQLQRMEITPAMVAVAIAVGVGFSYSDAAVTVANAAFFRRSAAVFLTLSSWLRVAALGVAYAAGARSATSLALALAIAVLAFVPLQILDLRRSEGGIGGGGRTLDRSYLRSVVTYSLPLFAWGVPGYVLGFGDRLLLAYYSDAAAVGVYAAMAAATINLTNAGSAAANRILEPTLFAASGAGTDAARVRPTLRMVSVTTLLLVPIAAPLVIVYMLWPETVIELFASASYTDGAEYLWLLLLASVLFLAAQQLMYRGYILKRPAVYVPLRLAHAVVLVGALVFTIPRWGLKGMILAILAAHVFQLLLVLLTNRFRLHAPVELPR